MIGEESELTVSLRRSSAHLLVFAKRILWVWAHGAGVQSWVRVCSVAEGERKKGGKQLGQWATEKTAEPSHANMTLCPRSLPSSKQLHMKRALSRAPYCTPVLLSALSGLTFKPFSSDEKTNKQKKQSSFFFYLESKCSRLKSLYITIMSEVKGKNRLVEIMIPGLD